MDSGNRLLRVEHFIEAGVDVVLVVGCSGGVSVLSILLEWVRAVNPAVVIINVDPHKDCVKGEHLFLPAPAAEVLTLLDGALLG